MVPNGQSLQAAIELAKKIAAFPQRCMRVDRLAGAQHFVGGTGRGGKFE